MPEDKKEAMTEEERLLLCHKMDLELDDFINSMERSKYSDGWSEDKWEEEMDKHPFFMKATPENGEMSPLAEGLAKLKYDPEENTPLELATNYKEDGNFNFKHMNYRLAILGYTEGIRVKCDSALINASLYHNRAASHMRLANYRSAWHDSEKAVSIKPDYPKARLLAAKSAIEIKKFDSSIQHCKKILEVNPNDPLAKAVLKSAKMKKTIYERDQRKTDRRQAKSAEERSAIVKAIVERGIKINRCHTEEDINNAVLGPPGNTLDETTVSMEDGVLKWPLLLLYPEFNMSDLITGASEDVPISEQLQQVFPAPWDTDNKYSFESINIYFEGPDLLPHVADKTKTLGQILKNKYFLMKAGTPAFLIVPKGSEIERRHLASYH